MRPHPRGRVCVFVTCVVAMVVCKSHVHYLHDRLFVTLVRFDPVYVVYFKTNFFSIRHSPLLGYIQDVYQAIGGPGGASIGASVDFSYIKNCYFRSHPHLNAFGIVPLGGPAEGVELTQPSGREALP